MSAWIPIAIVLKPHGVKGAFKVKSETDFKADRFQVGTELKLITPKTTQMITVESFQAMTAGDVLKAKECDDRDLALSWRGGTLYYEASKRDELEADAFYFDQLEGLDVFADGTKVGTVKALHDYPQGTMLRIETGGKDALVPFLKVFIESVDLDAGIIHLNAWEGLL